MNKSAEQTADISDNNLDVEFREMLCLIKNCIQHVTSNYYLSQYKAWLEKVNDATVTEKAARNVYLRELAKQIQQNSLSAPFNQAPPQGPLKIHPVLSNVYPKLSGSYEYIQNTNEDAIWPYNESDVTDGGSVYSHYSAPSTHYFAETSPGNQIMWPDVNVANVKHSSMGNLTQIQKPATWGPEQKPRGNKDCDSKSNAKKSRRSKFRKLGDIDHVDFCEGLNDLSESEIQMVQTTRSNKFRNHNNYRFKPDTEKIASIKEDSSWCDLTDADSAIALEGSGDAEKRLKSETESGQKVEEDKDDSGYSNVNCKNASNNVSTEINVEEPPRSPSLERAKMRLSNIMETKIGLKDTNFISEDWKKTIEGLQLRLSETVSQNNELKSVVQTLQNKIECDAVKYHEDLQRSLRQSESKHINEIKSLKKLHAEKICMLQKTLEAKMEAAEQDYQQKTASMVENYEMRIREFRHDHENSGKDIEIKKLTDLIDSQSDRTISAIAELKGEIATCKVGDEKQRVLEKCVSKMDKLFQKSENEYLKKIEKLKQELDLKDKAMHIHLSSQKAEIFARSSALKQEEFDDIINDLEVKYIKMLEQHETHTMATRKKDNARIERLLNLLSQYNIPYDNK